VFARRIAGLALCASVWAGLAAGAHAQEIAVALGSEPTTLDPQVQEDGSERAVNDNIYETLMARTADGTLVPSLAAAPPTTVDPTTWLVKLKPGIKFHDGSPFNADSVAFSINRIIDPKLKSAQLAFFKTIASATKVDDLTVKITTKGPDPLVPVRLYWMKMVPEAYAASDKFAAAPIGTGPYKFVGWDRGSTITIAANPDYWGEKPQIKKVTYRFVPESGTRLAGLMAGEFDLVPNLLPEFINQVPKTVHVESVLHPVLILNADGGITKDARVRQALNYAIDKTALAKALFEGYAKVDQGQLLSSADFAFDKTVSAYPYDPAKAKKLLAEAGAANGTLQIVGTAGRWLKDRETVEAVAAFWEAVGLHVDIKILEWNEYLKRLWDRQSRPDAVYVASKDPLLDPDRPFSTYYQAGGMGASNSDAKLAELVNKARTEIDLGERAKQYHEAIAIAHDQAYLAWLLTYEDLYGLSKRLSFQPRPDGKMLASSMTIAQ
jgi:peptide/nickel transport system substrate-binding protein